MAKGQYKEWLKRENLLLLQGWKREGLTDEQIAHNIGVTPRTLEYWKKKYVQIFQALKVGKEQANFIVENALFNKAINGHVTAQIFWLKNNWRDKYNDSQLSVEERELLKYRIKESELDTKIKEANALLKAFEVQIRKEEFGTDEDEERTDDLASAVQDGMKGVFGNGDEIET